MKQVYCTNLSAAFLLLVAFGNVECVADNSHYRWQNSSGETVFSDQPPPNGEKYDVISTPSNLKPVTSDVGGDVLQEDEPSVSNDSDVADSSSQPKEEGDSKNNAGLCKRAKRTLVALEGPDKVRVRNEKGELHELSPQERTIMQQTTKAQIDVYCE